jgi:hypothetical protein
MIKTFRGLLIDGGQDRIRLQTIKGKVGYKIIKFQVITEAVSTASVEHVLKIYKSLQTSITGTVNFTDSDLLGVAIALSGADAANNPISTTIVFDNEIFNQDIYITHTDIEVGKSCNYYIELEVIPLDDAGAEYTTLKDMRQP